MFYFQTVVVSSIKPLILFSLNMLFHTHAQNYDHSYTLYYNLETLFHGWLPYESLCSVF